MPLHGNPDQTTRQRLHDLLVENLQSTNRTKSPLDDAIDKAQQWIHQSLCRLEVLSPIEDNDDDKQALLPPLSIKQTIPFSLYSVPACLPPSTTVVPLRTLPHAQRSQFIQKWTPEEEDKTLKEEYKGLLWDDDSTLVEVPCSILFSDPVEMGHATSSSSSSSSVARRPLAGNLSTKLVEYTRGQIGKRNPFRPGGLDEEGDDVLDDVALEKLNPGKDSKQSEKMSSDSSCLLEKKIQARQVLDKGVVASWKDHTLLTAPSGMPFTIGLHPRDFYPSSEFEDEMNSTDLDAYKGSEDKMSVVGQDQKPNKFMATTASLPSKSPDFNKKLLEDPSLFEDSSSENDVDHNSLDKFEEDSVEEDENSLEKFEEDSFQDDDDEGKEEDDDEHSLEKFEDSSNEEEYMKSEDDNPTLDTEVITVLVETAAAPLLREDQRDNQSSKSKVLQDDGIDDVDSLLQELSLSAETSVVEKALALQKQRAKSLGDTMNTLASNEAVATMKAQKKNLNPTSNTNLSWAVTSLLPLQDFHALVPNPAITYPFELDDFQKQAVARLERGECIFVAAHTSAGKTVCAEYAIALSRKHCTRTIYTSPIKALSNQKYRDFKEKFGQDVGIITGDVQIGADASCLIMTTEILRSMLYRGADLVRDIEFVIFDEVHYINDLERGVVYEEVIIMLPDYVKLIFLSATTPNTVEFSEWIGRTKQKHVHVIRTDYRPVPLSHYLYAGQKLHKIMEANGAFIEKGWSDAAKALIPLSEREKQLEGKKKGPLGGSKQTTVASFKMSSGSKENAWQQPGSKQEFISLVKFLEKECLMPTVVFSFSRKKCEELAYMLNSLDLNSAVEKSNVHIMTTQASARLSHSDSKLPQVLAICEMVKRGIGVHHSGLLPLLKELIEILFSKNLIKVLFATETFAMGVNMPAKSVVFNTIRKHDGIQHRFLQPGEYVQMGGRAGRRQLDKVGTVIITCFGEEPPPAAQLRQMLTGTATKLLSQFRLTYNMILNLLRVEDMSVESMIKRSFSEFATQRALGKNEYPKLLAKGIKTLANLDESFRKDSPDYPDHQGIENYYLHCAELLDLNRFVLNILVFSAGAVGNSALCPGRVLLLTSARRKGVARSVAVVLKSPVNPTSQASLDKSMVCLVLLPTTFIPTLAPSDRKQNPKQLEYVGYVKRRHYAIKEMELDEILIVTDIKIKLDPLEFYDDSIGVKQPGGRIDAMFTSASARNRTNESNFLLPGPRKGQEIDTRSSQDDLISRLIDAEALESKDGIGTFDFKDTLKGLHHGQQALDVKDACSRMIQLTSEIRQYTSHKAVDLVKHYAIVEKKETLRAAVKKLRHMLSHESLELFPDFMQRKSILHSLGYIDENDTVCIKGRVACEVNTCEEIIVTELVFAGILNALTPAELAACLSALVFQEKNNEDDLSSDLPQNVLDTCKVMKGVATDLGTVQKNHGLNNIDPNEYCDNALKFGLVHVVYEWAMGVPFSNICELTSVQEGSIVRCITRLDELCREVRNCARVVGNPTLYKRAEEASNAVKRDIVFVASLYVN